jgi:hypothetical protein
MGMRATCQMSNGCCAMCNAVVKMIRPPTDPMTKLIPEKALAIGQLAIDSSLQLHYTSHNSHSTFDKLWSPAIRSQFL